MAWFDFSSGRNGNIFDFVMATEGLSFPEAVERLAGEAGLELPRRTAEDSAREEKRAGLVRNARMGRAILRGEPCRPRAARAGRAYLAERGLGAEVAARVPASATRRPSVSRCATISPAKGARREAMIEAGPAGPRRGHRGPYDRFRDRVMFPIADRSGRVIAFGGRALEQGRPGQIPELAGDAALPQGRGALQPPPGPQGRGRPRHGDRRRRLCRRHRHDGAPASRNVVAPLGTALTPEQCELLWRMAPRADPVFRRRRGRAARRLPGARHGPAAASAPDRTLALRLPARRPGSRTTSPARAARRPSPTCLAKARPLVDVLWARETEGGRARHARAPRRARAAPRRPRPRHRRRDPAPPLRRPRCARGWRA